MNAKSKTKESPSRSDLIKAMQEIDRISRSGDVHEQPLLLPIRRKINSVLPKKKGHQ